MDSSSSELLSEPELVGADTPGFYQVVTSSDSLECSPFAAVR